MALDVLKQLAAVVPPIRRLRDARDTLIADRTRLAHDVATKEEELRRLTATAASPFNHYNTCFDGIAMMQRHAAPGLEPTPGFCTNFLGVKIDPAVFPDILRDTAGTVEGIPIPANWHSDIAEWAAALRAVDLAGARFTLHDLGCGWGCWMMNTGVAARRAGKEVRLIGVEADDRYLRFAQDARDANGFAPEHMRLLRGIASGSPGYALFPRQDVAAGAETSWGLEPVFGATEAQRAEAVRSGRFDELPMLPLAEIVGGEARLDLLHMDIQGGEAALVASSLPVLAATVAYLVIGTHSRQIEGRLFETLLGAGWVLEVERPSILNAHVTPPGTLVDGVQGWRNPRLA